MSRCNKGVICSHCHERIETGEPEVYGKLWMQLKGEKPRKWVKVLHWHGKRKKDGQCCWLVQALDALSQRPFVETRGRKKLVMPKEMRDSRLKCLRQRAKIMQQLKIVMDEPPKKRDIDAIIRLGGRLEDVKARIVEFGGVPKSWG